MGPFFFTPIRLGKPKPNLSIDTKTPSSGNEGLDKEQAWREKSAFCEHDFEALYQADEKDSTSPVECDFTHDTNDDAGKSKLEKMNNPTKHPAVEGEGDVAFLCNKCHAIACKDCIEDYSDDENTPTDDKEKPFSGNNTVQDTKEKSSILDDFANTSTEMPDYTSGED